MKPKTYKNNKQYNILLILPLNLEWLRAKYFFLGNFSFPLGVIELRDGKRKINCSYTPTYNRAIRLE